MVNIFFIMIFFLVLFKCEWLAKIIECPQLYIKFEFAVALVLDSGGNSLLVVGLV